jgi:hypothetical protein
MSGRQYAWLLVGLLWIVAFLNYVDRQVIFSLVVLGNQDLIDKMGVAHPPSILAHLRIRSLVGDFLGLLPQPCSPSA